MAAPSVSVRLWEYVAVSLAGALTGLVIMLWGLTRDTRADHVRVMW